MSKPVKKALLPALRFPEFVDAGEWNTDMLGQKDISIFVKERTPLAQLKLESYISTENLLPDYAGITIATKLPPTGSFTRFKKGDILISNIRPYLKKVWFATRDGTSSNDVIVIRAGSNVSSSFLICILKNDEFINYVMKGAKGVKMPRGDISLMKEYLVAFPCPEEQQKIADCLSSLDALITAHTQKHEALKAHKKGLMQQLFPAEGETVPTLRFPEFLDAGEWEEKPLGSMCSNISSGKDKSDINGTYDLYGSTGVIGKTSNDTFTGDFILAARVGANAGLLTRTSGKFGVTDNTLIISLKRSEKISFIYYSLDRLGLNKMVFGSGQPLITGRQLKDLGIKAPTPEEQQKIADFLTSIDELITVQSQKIDSLKAHKKGLMQQLFPAIDDDCINAKAEADA